MYTLMNKNNPLIDFELVGDRLQGYEVVESRVYKKPWFITNLKSWLQHRFAPRHRANIDVLLGALHLRDLKSLVEFTRASSLTDTLWINCNDRYKWDKVNLFENEFDEAIAQVAFSGKVQGKLGSQISPEFTTDGAFPKCWIRDTDGIYLMKQGTGNFASNSGLEPYSEQYCSEVLSWMGYEHVEYTAVSFQGVLVSKCRLLTSQERMMVPLGYCLTKCDLAGVIEFCEEHDILEALYEILMFDYLVTNNDRHLNNIGVLMDVNNFEVLGLAPIFDNGAGLLPYAVKPDLESYESSIIYASAKGPRFYRSFFEGASLALDRLPKEPIEGLLEFKFRRDYELQLPEWRVIALEQYVQGQARSLLEGRDPEKMALSGLDFDGGKTSMFD